jgi:hypothetical protein
LSLAFLLAASFALFAAGSAKFVRLSDRPILAPSGSGWESAGTFNIGVAATDALYTK